MIFLLAMLATTCVLLYFHNRNTQQNLPSVTITYQGAEKFTSTDDNDGLYCKLITNRPDYSLYVTGDYYDCYNDSFQTPEGYKLRELLLLVWWGKTKKGREIDANIPKYFYDRYKINPNKVTKMFFSDSLIELVDGRVKLTDRGRELYQQYQSLWDIHSQKGFYGNLDNDFPTWDTKTFLIVKNTQKVNYLKAMARYHRDLLEYYRKYEPKNTEEANYHQDQCTYYLDQVNLVNTAIDALME
ncbi:MAG: hypothetical protein SPF57_09955 [Streptococcus orisratti]|uniref:hypothetical protein n=1 Tax=Streptococcus orisratti TaxID=114652 RepID=UPI002A91C7D1|nr:hypothetical protein [Streptococcus orisratti]MDY5636629.1 hypothetical protein [Streptococcus orisratti]